MVTKCLYINLFRSFFSKSLNCGTVPPFSMRLRGIVPLFSMHLGGTFVYSELPFSQMSVDAG